MQCGAASGDQRDTRRRTTFSVSRAQHGAFDDFDEDDDDAFDNNDVPSLLLPPPAPLRGRKMTVPRWPGTSSCSGRTPARPPNVAGLWHTISKRRPPAPVWSVGSSPISDAVSSAALLPEG